MQVLLYSLLDKKMQSLFKPQDGRLSQGGRLMGEISKEVFQSGAPQRHCLPRWLLRQPRVQPSLEGDEAILDRFPCKSRLLAESHGADSADSLASAGCQHEAPPSIAWNFHGLVRGKESHCHS